MFYSVVGASAYDNFLAPRLMNSPISYYCTTSAQPCRKNTLTRKCFSVETASFVIILHCISQNMWLCFLSNRQESIKFIPCAQEKRTSLITKQEWCLHQWCAYKLIAFHMCSLSFIALIHPKAWYLSSILQNSQPIFFKYVFGLHRQEHQMAWITGTL